MSNSSWADEVDSAISQLTISTDGPPPSTPTPLNLESQASAPGSSNSATESGSPACQDTERGYTPPSFHFLAGLSSEEDSEDDTDSSSDSDDDWNGYFMCESSTSALDMHLSDAGERRRANQRLSLALYGWEGQLPDGFVLRPVPPDRPPNESVSPSAVDEDGRLPEEIPLLIVTTPEGQVMYPHDAREWPEEKPVCQVSS